MAKNLIKIVLFLITFIGCSISQAQGKKSDWNNLDSVLSTLGTEILPIELVIPQKQKIEAETFWNKGNFEKEFIEAVLKFSAIEKLNLSEFKLNQEKALSVFYFLSLTKKGRRFLEIFIPKLLDGKITISLASKESCENDFSSVKTGVPAYYLRGVIHIASQFDLLNILAFLIHEGVHSLDFIKAEREEKAAIIYKADVSKSSAEYKEAANIIIESEHKAYRAMQIVVDELSDIHISFSRAIQILRENRFLNYPTSLEEFRIEMTERSYDIPQDLIDDYFRKRDWKYFN